MTRALIWCAVSSRAQNEPDKISLPQQEADARALCVRNEWQITDILRVPGHSRRYIDIHELAADAAKEGIDAFYRLLAHWDARDFDVLIVRDGERFARTQALHAYVVERTITIDARIYSLVDGWVDERNYRMWIAMAGYKAAGDIDRLVKARKDAITARAQRGLPVSSRIPISHKLIRDPLNGRAIRLEVDESKRRLWDDLALLILEGVAWERIDLELYNRFGHVMDNGKPYYAHYMYRLIMKPLFWGHTARNHNSATSKNGFRFGSWIYDESESIPEGAIMFRNTHPPVWEGELADLIKAEVKRRSETVRGNSDPERTHRFSGLGVCAECGSFLATFVNDGYRGLICPAGKVKFSPKRPTCNNRKIINERKIVVRLNDYLQQMLERNTTEVFGNEITPQNNVHGRLEKLSAEITLVEEQARTLIRRQASAGEELQGLYDEELNQVNVRLRNMRVTRAGLQAQTIADQQAETMQHITLEELTSMTLEVFWKQESRYINQILHRLMGKKRLLGLKGEIIGVAEVNRRQRRHV
jgi:hypothetical protein